MLAIVVVVHNTTRAPQIVLNGLMVAFLNVGYDAQAAAFACTTHRVHAVDVCIITQSLGHLWLRWSRQPESATRGFASGLDLDQYE